MTITTMDRVQAGAAALDKRVPNWRERVNPETLNIEDPWNCIMGQLYGSYLVGLSKFDHDGSLWNGGHIIAPSSLGFCAVEMGEYPVLNDAWKQVLAA